MKVLTNAKIYTMNEKTPEADTIAYEGKEIIYVGTGWNGGGEIYDMSGRTILPGIIDSHIHPGMCARSAWHVRLPWTEDADELLEFVKKYAEKHPKEELPFIYFEYYPTSMFDENGPRKELLDEAVSDRPVLCQDFGEHLCWVNSRMLELLGVDKDTPDPSSLEVFVRDDDGSPTGWVKEMAWMHFADRMYDDIGWRPPEELDEKALEPFFDFLSDSGITAMFDGFIETDKQIESIFHMDKAGKLNTYYDGSVRFWKYEDLPEKIAKLRSYQQRYTTEHIKINTLKLFLDGTNESGNSASLQEHIHDPGNFGDIMMEADELAKCFILANRESLDIHIHVVGDRGFRVCCDAVESAQKAAAEEGRPWVCRPVLAHCEVVDPADMERPAKLGIAINWSCHWSGGYFGEEAMNYYTEEKWRRMYRFNEMIDCGAAVAFSSDVVTNYELHRAYPYFGMQVAATRVDPEFPLDPEKYPSSMRPQEDAKLNVKTLVRGYTLTGAHQLRMDDIMGSLEKGKIANLVVLDRDVMETPPEKLKEIKTEAVIFDGKVIRGAI
ncbi:MAG: amidohydrolase family protein [Bacillota bacterium]|nr:amidohydrolase family protein [Bacillota bacterium]